MADVLRHFLPMEAGADGISESVVPTLPHLFVPRPQRQLVLTTTLVSHPPRVPRKRYLCPQSAKGAELLAA